MSILFLHFECFVRYYTMVSKICLNKHESCLNLSYGASLQYTRPHISSILLIFCGLFCLGNRCAIFLYISFVISIPWLFSFATLLEPVAKWDKIDKIGIMQKENRESYPSDLTDNQWKDIEPLHTGMRKCKWSKENYSAFIRKR